MNYKSSAILVLLSLVANVAYLQNATNASAPASNASQAQSTEAVIIYPLEWDWSQLEEELDTYCNQGLEESNSTANATQQAVENVVVAPDVPANLRDLVFYLSQLIDAEMKRRCPGCGGLSAKPIDFIFNTSSPIPADCVQTQDGRLCCTDANLSNLTVCLTYDQMNVFYNYNLVPVCNAIETIVFDGVTCPGDQEACIQQNLYNFMSSANIIYFWLHFDDNAKSLIFNQCEQIQGFNVTESIFDGAFDFNPALLLQNSTQAANATAPAANATGSS